MYAVERDQRGERMNSLLPPGSTPLERRLAQTCSGISDLQVSLA
ncbi:putative phage tail protein [Salmonella enterica subsp. enterica]|uniref:Putative phage tail protein n=1 Tax=Salmonella enterica I TaxID=59201 RepID=A0A3S4J0T6_SALET|nr:putative phage tail protein [Salmonella enterica subsp. enterica]